MYRDSMNFEIQNVYSDIALTPVAMCEEHIESWCKLDSKFCCVTIKLGLSYREYRV